MDNNFSTGAAETNGKTNPVAPGGRRRYWF